MRPAWCESPFTTLQKDMTRPSAMGWKTGTFGCVVRASDIGGALSPSIWIGTDVAQLIPIDGKTGTEGKCNKHSVRNCAGVIQNYGTEAFHKSNHAGTCQTTPSPMRSPVIMY